MAERGVQWTADAVGGRVTSGDPGSRWRRIALDSRKIEGGELFVALPGEQADGHDFVAQAAARGAAAVLVHRDVSVKERGEGDGESATAVIRVADTYEALHELTRAVRRETPEHVVGITGSAGKTTTKELIAAVLGTTFRVAKSPGNFNNLFGFPLSLLGIDDDTEWMVAEMGMSTPGELRGVSLLGRPDLAVFTNVRPAHLMNFDSVRGIAEAKSELLAGLSDDGTIVANADDPEVMRVARRHAERHPSTTLLTYGVIAEDADVRGSDLRALSESGRAEDLQRLGSRFRLRAPRFGVGDGGGEAAAGGVEMELGVHGLYNVENALAAVACGLHLGVGLEPMREALRGFRAAAMRGEVHRLASGAVVVDDSYNSNPDAAARALESARRLPGRRHVAILGDMLELGPREGDFHAEVGRKAAELGFEVVAVGPLSQHLADAARTASGATDVPHFDDAAACAAWVRGGGLSLGEGDVVLVKASRGTGLEAAVRALLPSAGEEAA